MRNLLFKDSLELELNVIGYHNQGESIVFFIRTDGYVAYTGMVDCYKTRELDVVRSLLEKEQVKKIDFICWTHPHDDHTIGLDGIWDEYCTEETRFCCTDIIKARPDLYSSEAMVVFEHIASVQCSSKRKKTDIMYLTDFTQAERLRCIGNAAQYEFRICSFAPKSAMLGERLFGNKDEQGNVYSIGIYLFFGEYSIMLAGDVENPTFRKITDADVEYPIDYIKIPHHGSKSADFLPDKLTKLNITAPNIASTTLFRKHKLPQSDVVDKYFEWGCQEVYATGNIEDENSCVYGYGIIKTVFDILQRKEYIETELLGDAILYEKEMIG